MVLSFKVENFDAVHYLLNEFSGVIDGYSLEFSYEKPQLLVLFITQGLEQEAMEISDLVSTLIRTYQQEFFKGKLKSHKPTTIVKFQQNTNKQNTKENTEETKEQDLE
jgi:hypothetical protein